MDSSTLKINIGQGARPEDGFEGCDHVAREGIKHVFDLRTVWPFANESVDEIRARQILEHFAPGDDLFMILGEAHRVLKKGGKLEFWVPKYPESIYVFLPDHLSYWTETFVKALDTEYQKRGFDFAVEKVETIEWEPGNVDVHGILCKR